MHRFAVELGHASLWFVGGGVVIYRSVRINLAGCVR